MRRVEAAGLNVSGEDGVTRVVAGGALHLSRSQRTSVHAHLAWKIHVGLDAPVWLDGARPIPVEDGARVIVVPPNVTHATGASGLSLAIFAAPGSRGCAWRDADGPRILTGRRAADVLALCRRFQAAARDDSAELVDAIAPLAFARAQVCLDRRVAAAVTAAAAGCTLLDIARQQRLSPDRLSYLVSKQTGAALRRHALWHKLLRVLSNPQPSANLAAAALDAGFADHAHMTRTFRALLGRAPSEFRAPPDVVAPW